MLIFLTGYRFVFFPLRKKIMKYYARERFNIVLIYTGINVAFFKIHAKSTKYLCCSINLLFIRPGIVYFHPLYINYMFLLLNSGWVRWMLESQIVQ